MGCSASSGSSEEVAGVDVASGGRQEGDSTVKRSPRDYLFKTIMIGDLHVGKSSLLLQFTDGTFTEQYMTTLAISFKTRTVKLDGETVKFQLWDTAGQERFRSLSPSYYRGADAIMILYDITNQESFNNVKQWVDDIERYTRGDVAKVLVGNKTDLTTDRVIDYTTAKEYADDLGIPFLETSAKDYINVEQAFITLAAATKNKEDSR